MEYLYIDGDGVGPKLHALLINTHVREAARLSESVTRAVARISAMLRDAGAEVVFAGGDNLFVRGNADRALLERIIALFHMETGLTASIGVGDTPSDAFLAVTVAKSLGGGRVIWRKRAPVTHSSAPQ